MERREDLVIVGAGYSGLTLALHLGREMAKLSPSKRRRITLIAKEPVQTLQCELYKVLRHGKARQLAFLDSLKRLNIRWLEGQVLDINTESRCLRLRSRSEPLSYSGLVAANGSEASLPPIEGLSAQIYPAGMIPRRAFLFQKTSDALGIRMRLSQMKWGATSNPGDQDQFAVVLGAGPNGLEVAGELASLRQSNPRCRVVLVDQSSELLPTFSPIARRVLKSQISQLGIETILGSPVEQCTSQELKIRNGQVIPWQLLVVCAGSKSRPFWAKDAPPGHWSIGDLDAAQPENRTAQWAVQQAQHVARRILWDWDLGPHPGSFQPQDLGLLISLGPHHGIGRIGPTRSSSFLEPFVYGRSVGLLKSSAELRYRTQLRFFREALNAVWT